MHKQDKASRPSKPQWYRDLASFQRGAWGPAVGQLLTSLLPYLALFAFGVHSVEAGWSYWFTILISVPAAFFLIRTFIIFHDCTHGSFVPSAKGNRIIGFITGALAMTPFESWRQSHLKHHATNGQLDHRGFGDVWTMTFEEFRDASAGKRLWYRIYRNPFFMFVLGPLFTFVLAHRVADLRKGGRVRRSVLGVNAFIVILAVSVWLLASFKAYVLVQLPVIMISGTMGIWLFYVQHQFDPGYWARDGEWDQIDAALHGSSYYKLPPVLRWFTGNIGIHHLHHLRPSIPNYRLQKAYNATPQVQEPKPLTVWESIKSIRINLWHEVEQRFLSFRQAVRIMRGSATVAVSRDE
jgi:omega-6 fatty acid desaturase (delta-12 desaturase)